MKLPHPFTIIWAQARRLNAFTSARLLVCLYLFAGFSFFVGLLLQIPWSFFVRTAPMSPLKAACTFVWADVTPRLPALEQFDLAQSFKDFSGAANVTTIDQATYSLVLNQSSLDQLIAINACRLANFVHVKMVFKPEHFQLSITQHLFGNKIDLTNLDETYYSSVNDEEHESGVTYAQQRIHWFRDIIEVVNVGYNLTPPIQLDRIHLSPLVESTNIGEQFYAYIDLMLRLFFLLLALSMANFFNVDLLFRDHHNRYLATLIAAERALHSRTNILHYLAGHWLWSLLFGGQAVVILLTLLCSSLIFTSSYYAIVFWMAIALMQLSADLLLTNTFLVMLINNQSAALVGVFSVCLNYLVVVGEVNGHTTLWFDEMPTIRRLLYAGMCCLTPGILIEHLASLFAQISQQPSTTLQFQVLLVLFFYTLLLAAKFWILSTLYYYFGDNIREWAPLSPDPFLRGRVLKPLKITNEEGTLATYAALHFNAVKKRLPCGRMLNIETLTVFANEICVFYTASSDRQVGSVVAQMAAFLAVPSRGTVEAFPLVKGKNMEMPAKVAFVVTKSLQFCKLTVLEYLKLFANIQRIRPELQWYQIHRLLSYLQLEAVAYSRTGKLSPLEQLKLATAIAMLGTCTVLVYDQPSAELPYEQRHQFWNILQKVKGMKAIFVTTSCIDEVDYLADYIAIYNNGSIITQNTPHDLQKSSGASASAGGQQQKQFNLHISKSSKMLKADIENFIQKSFQKSKNEVDSEVGSGGTRTGSTVAKVNSSEKSKAAVSAVASEPSETGKDHSKVAGGSSVLGGHNNNHPVVCHLKKDTLYEYIFSFVFEGTTQQRYITRLLDRIQRKAIVVHKKDGAPIIVNAISRCSLHEAFEDILGGRDAEQLPTLTSALVNDPKRPRHASTWTSLKASLWGHFCIITTWPPLAILALFLLASTTTLLTRYLLENLVGTRQAKLWTVWKEDREFVCRVDCNLTSTYESEPWLQSHYMYFKNYSTNLQSIIKIQNKSDLISSNSYDIEVHYNRHSPHPDLFTFAAPLRRILSEELASKQIAVSVNFAYAGHYTEGSNPLEVILFFLYRSIPLTLYTVVYLVGQWNILSEIRSRFWYFRRTNGLPMRCFIICEAMAAAVMIVLGTWTAFLLVPHLGVFESWLDEFTRETVKGTAVSMAIYGMALVNGIFFEGRYRAAVLVFLIILMQFKDVIFVLALCPSSTLTESTFWIIANLAQFLLPSILVNIEFQRIFLRWFSFFKNTEDYFDSMLPWYRMYLYSGTALRNVIFIGIETVALYASCCLYYPLKLCWYRRQSLKAAKSKGATDGRVKVQTFIANDRTVQEELIRIEGLINSGPEQDPEDIFLVRGLCQSAKTRALKNINFIVKRGQCFGIFGLVGCGKTKLLEILAGVEPFDAGNFGVWKEDVGFRDLASDGHRGRQKNTKKFTFNESPDEPRFKRLPPTDLAFAPKYNCIHNSLTTRQALLMWAMIRLVPSELLDSELRKITKIFQLNGVLDQLGSRLTSYEARRLTLASAFIGNPKIVLVDAPTADVPFTYQRCLWGMLQAVMTMYRSTVVLASDSTAEMEALCCRVGVLIQGRLRFIGQDRRLRSRYCKAMMIQFKIPADKFKDQSYMSTLNTRIAETFPECNPIGDFHKSSTLIYQLKKNTSQPWSQILLHLETLSDHFHLVTYTLNIASLNQMIFFYAQKGDRLSKSVDSQEGGREETTLKKNENSQMGGRGSGGRTTPSMAPKSSVLDDDAGGSMTASFKK